MIFQQQFDFNTRLSLVIDPHIFFSQLWNETLSLFLWNVCYACNFKMKIIEDKVHINSIMTNWIKRLVCGLEFYCLIGNRWVYHLLMSSWYVLHVLAYNLNITKTKQNKTRLLLYSQYLINIRTLGKIHLDQCHFEMYLAMLHVPIS